MAIILGNSAAPESYLGQFPGAVYFDTLGNARTPTEDGTLVSASVWVKDGAATGRGVKIGLYDADLNLLATADITDTSGAEGFKTALLDTPVAVTTAQTYRFGTITQTRNPPTIGTGGSRFWQYDDGLSYSDPLPNPPAADNSTSVPKDLRIYFSTADSPSATITAADDVTTEGQTATFTLSGNTAAPVSATLNGTDVGTLTDQGSGVYSYTAPLIADDDTADLVVSVDGTTVDTTISYANGLPYALTDHAEPDANSVMFGNQFGTTGPVELAEPVLVSGDTGAATIDWSAMDSAQGWTADINTYATANEDGTQTWEFAYLIAETNQSGTFQRTLQVGNGGIIVVRAGMRKPMRSKIARQSLREKL